MAKGREGKYYVEFECLNLGTNHGELQKALTQGNKFKLRIKSRPNKERKNQTYFDQYFE